MKSIYKPTSLLVLGTLCLGIWLGGAGCDFTRVDEGAQRPLNDIVASLGAADTPDKAEGALEELFFKAEVGIDHKESVYAGYKFEQEDLKRLAQIHAAYVAGGQVPAVTFEDVYNGMKVDIERLGDIDVPFQVSRSLTAPLEDVLNIFQLSVQYALATPERPEHALLIALVAERGAIPQEVPVFEGSQQLSPVQHLVFYMWLDRYGHTIASAEGEAGKTLTGGGGNKDCPTGTFLIAKFDDCHDGSCRFERPDGNQGIVTLAGGTDHRSHINWTSTAPIEAIVVKGAWYAKVITVPGDQSGSISKQLIHYKDISNVKFCGEEPPPDDDDLKDCIKTCQKIRAWCLYFAQYAGDKKEEAKAFCDILYRKCDWACHNQGSGGHHWD